MKKFLYYVRQIAHSLGQEHGAIEEVLSKRIELLESKLLACALAMMPTYELA